MGQARWGWAHRPQEAQPGSAALTRPRVRAHCELGAAAAAARLPLQVWQATSSSHRFQLQPRLLRGLC